MKKLFLNCMSGALSSDEQKNYSHRDDDDPCMLRTGDTGGRDGLLLIRNSKGSFRQILTFSCDFFSFKTIFPVIF